jgi:uncharacterized protein YndB with AHSA1/START domain
MTKAETLGRTRDIVIDELLPHTPELVWKMLTTPEMIGRWLKMPLAGFAAVAGNRFTYRTTPAGEWDGVIHCEVIEAVPGKRLAYSWRGGHESNQGYGAPLDTVVTWTLAPAEGGTRLHMVHSGFSLPRNETAFTGMSKGWPGVVARIDELAGDAED